MAVVGCAEKIRFRMARQAESVSDWSTFNTPIAHAPGSPLGSFLAGCDAIAAPPAAVIGRGHAIAVTALVGVGARSDGDFDDALLTVSQYAGMHYRRRQR